jgi:glucosamine kinase
MVIIADSGSTKADWKLISNNKVVKTIRTMGFNPFFHTEKIIVDELTKCFQNELDVNDVSKVHFYGAGCSSEDRNQIIQTALTSFFPNSKNEVYHDILASARATCGNNPGIACILGTGSNSCAYDGIDITDNLPSLGFMLGDEGSGSSFGKLLIRKIFYRELSEDLLELFNSKYKLSKEDILDSLYNKPHVNVFLAKFSEFYSENQNHPQVKKMVKTVFTEFFECHIVKYKNHDTYPIHFVGSIGFIFRPILEEVAKDFKVNLGVTIKNPIDSLVNFHINTFSENLI